MKNENTFYLLQKHNSICDNINIKIYDNNADVTKNVYGYAQYKDDLIKFLNLNPLISIHEFTKYAMDLFLKNDLEFVLKKNTFKNIFYPWRKNSKIFNWISIFDNSLTIDKHEFLKDVSFSFIYSPKGKNVMA